VILFIKHIDIEGPDTLEAYFKEKKFRTQTIELQGGDRLPDDLGSMDAIISLGGPMNVYEEEKYPFLKDEDRFIKEIVSREIPFMGICLGSQLLAKACGAKVHKSPEKEIGFLPVEVTQDILFEGLDRGLNVFHWHEDMSELPYKAKLLASSRGCPHQAFKIGDNAYGLQFHIEVTEQTVQKWTEAYFSNDNAVEMKQKEKIMRDYRMNKDRFYKIANTISDNFLKVIHNHKIERSRF
jgi:GMP synthase-like glutamine amidotransferase